MESRVAGPGAIDDVGVAPKSLLEGASEYEYVEVLNPLPVDFIGIFAVTRPIRAQITVSNHPNVATDTTNEEDVKRNYGLNLNNPDHQGKTHIQNRITIPAGETVRILGNEAQVIVKQLVNEIMQREKNSLMLADPYQRNLVEQRIIRSRNSVTDLMNSRPVSVQDQIKQALDESNQTEFPGLKEDDARTSIATGDEGFTESSTGSGTEAGKPERRGPGRPKKA